MKKFKNFIPLDYDEKERKKSYNRISRIMWILVLLNLIFFPMSIKNIKTEFFSKPETLDIVKKNELISIEKINILIDKSKKYNGELKLSNNSFTIKVPKTDENKLLKELYSEHKVKLEYVQYNETFDEIRGTINE